MQHLERLAERGAVRGDRRRPDQLVEVRVLAGELEVVVPAGADVVGDVRVYDCGAGAFGLEEGGPAEIDNSCEQPFLVAEVVVERRRCHAGRLADSTGRDIGVGGAREQLGGGFKDAGPDSHGVRLAVWYTEDIA